MARRSNKGRFRVWDKPSDSFNHEDLVYNWDELDKLIGGTGNSTGDFTSGAPGISSWLGPGDGGNPKRDLYSIVTGLNYNDTPLGSVILWWRPTASTALPDGWVPADGSVYAAGQHSYPFSDSIVVPDLRNAIPMGANIDNTTAVSTNPGTWGTANKGDAGLPSNDPDDAPGIGYHSKWDNFEGNEVRDTRHSHTAGTYTMANHVHNMDHFHYIEGHSHAIPAHTHGMRHFHWIQNHEHSAPAGTRINSHTDSIDVDSTEVRVDPLNSGGYRVSHITHYHSLRAFDTKGMITGVDRYLAQSEYFPTFHIPRGDVIPTPVNATSFAINAQNGVVDAGNVNTQYVIAPERTVTDSTALTTSAVGQLKTIGSPYGYSPPDYAGPGVTNGALSVYTKFQNTNGINGSSGQNTSVTEVDVRPNYVGLLFIVRIKVANNLLGIGGNEDYPGWAN